MERSEGGERGDTKPGMSAILAATQNPYSFPPLPSPLSPLAPSLSSRRNGRRGRWLQPPPAAAWKSSSCHLPSRVRMAHFCRIPFGPAAGTEGGFGGPVHAGAATVAFAGWFALRSPVRGALGLGRRPWAPGLHAASQGLTRPRYPPPPVAKAGRKASGEDLEKPKRCWSRAQGSWK